MTVDLNGPNESLLRGQGVALWRQIAQAIEADIAAGHLAAGVRLPTEAELSARFNVNRHTVRRAMEDLEGRGLVRIEQGRGSFVAEDMVDYHLGPRTRFSERIRQQNREPAGRIIRVTDALADAQMAENLRIRPGRPVVVVDRLGMVDGRPVVLGTHHFPGARFGRMRALLAEDPSISNALAACGVSDYTRAWTRLTARLPTAEEAELLEQARARPVLVSEALSVDPDGLPIDWGVGRYASGRVQIVVEE
ncbi:phosphonate metabolism transcriptional regulator PhnF [Acetobacteraceae bacterium H6797]|nr:phosphonate metabolism transcriptional regulator PhnF [Acetobacteraceae bacterium H6797]